MIVNGIGVIGAGTMGRGIAYVSALGGYTTYLFDPQPGQVDGALVTIRRDFDKAVEKALVTREAADAAIARIVACDKLEQAGRESDLVIEAVPENMALKIELFQKLEPRCPGGTIFATNTSALSITEMAAATGRAYSVIGMHFFNPVPRMKLLEIVRGLETSDNTVETCREVGVRMGKEIAVVNESPGFITSRINAMIGNEAFYMLESGVASASEIDRALKLGLNHPMGPFEMVDLVGLDVRLSILQYLHATLGEKFRPCPLMAKYVKAGRLGRKVGRGVYSYDEKGNRIT
ncbi:MAG: 3-hydroxyacyl-CoA dehydrogenase NAD-binding domain-containing protein [Candidatus Eisenbacteria bacterium]|nr:3-hydroxyacyl-CoA dehydrogenase NAD-binding domain-containing protein [Candidatus Eisenbacteria bacterium]